MGSHANENQLKYGHTHRRHFEQDLKTYFGKLLDWNQHFLAQLHVLVDDDVNELLLFLALIFLDFFNFYKRREGKQRRGTGERRFSQALYTTDLGAVCPVT